MRSQTSSQQPIGRREWMWRHLPTRILRREYNVSMARQSALQLTLGSSSTFLFHPFALFVLKVPVFLAQPLWVGNGAIKLVTRFVKFELARFRSLCRFCQKSSNLGRVHRLEAAGSVEGLLKDRE